MAGTNATESKPTGTAHARDLAGNYDRATNAMDRATYALMKLELVNGLLSCGDTSTISEEALNGAYVVMRETIETIGAALNELWQAADSKGLAQ